MAFKSLKLEGIILQLSKRYKHKLMEFKIKVIVNVLEYRKDKYSLQKRLMECL